MNILVACEESQRVTLAFREKGHNAFSCDIQECSGKHPEYHIKGNVIPILNGQCAFYTMDGKCHYISNTWDMIIAFPPCTYLTLSGNRWYNTSKYRNEAHERNKKRTDAINFFLTIANAKAEKIAIENPIGIMSTKYKKPSQIIQSWEYAESKEENTIKSTCLWLKNLPLLIPRNLKQPRIEYKTWTNKNGKQKRQTAWYYKTRCLPHKERSKEASKTFPGIAHAMAEQWG
ncbi:MAG: hypothetical protein IJY23_01150 [Clostridia bacterium]|nr:hypothetical protein [Clostridia bacterium]